MCNMWSNSSFVARENGLSTLKSSHRWATSSVQHFWVLSQHWWITSYPFKYVVVSFGDHFRSTGLGGSEIGSFIWLKAEVSLRKCSCAQPSYCPFAIWDTPLRKQLSTDGKTSRLFFFLRLLFCSCIPKCRSEARWTIAAKWKELFQQTVAQAAGILPFRRQTNHVSWTPSRFAFWRFVFAPFHAGIPSSQVYSLFFQLPNNNNNDGGDTEEQVTVQD